MQLRSASTTVESTGEEEGLCCADGSDDMKEGKRRVATRKEKRV
jgi:hypothetical protein